MYSPASEFPPKSKKLSVIPIAATTSTPSHILASLHSVTFLGGTTDLKPGGDCAGAGSALRSNFPLGSRGNDSTMTNADGTIDSGSVAPIQF